jgi:hypothetical protein
VVKFNSWKVINIVRKTLCSGVSRRVIITLFLFHDPGSESFQRTYWCVLHDTTWEWGAVCWLSGVRWPYKPSSLCCLHTNERALLQRERVSDIFLSQIYIHTSAFQSIHECATGTEYKTCQTNSHKTITDRIAETSIRPKSKSKLNTSIE